MKKIFTLLSVVLGLSFTSSAQTLTFTHDGEVIPAGSTFMSDNIYEDPLGDIFEIPDEVRPEIFLSCNVNETVVCVVEDVDKVGNVKFCFGGDCQVSGTGGIYAIEKEYTFSGTALDIQLDFVLPLTGYGTGKAKVTAWVKGKEATTKVSINVVMTNDPSVISGINQSAAKNVTKVVGKTFYYNFDVATHRTLAIYGLNGSQIMSASLNDAAGALSLTELPKGVYIYRLADGANAIQRKFILK